MATANGRLGIRSRQGLWIVKAPPLINHSTKRRGLVFLSVIGLRLLIH